MINNSAPAGAYHPAKPSSATAPQKAPPVPFQFSPPPPLPSNFPLLPHEQAALAQVAGGSSAPNAQTQLSSGPSTLPTAVAPSVDPPQQPDKAGHGGGKGLSLSGPPPKGGLFSQPPTFAYHLGPPPSAELLFGPQAKYVRPDKNKRQDTQTNDDVGSGTSTDLHDDKASTTSVATDAAPSASLAFLYANAEDDESDFDGEEEEPSAFQPDMQTLMHLKPPSGDPEQPIPNMVYSLRPFKGQGHIQGVEWAPSMYPAPEHLPPAASKPPRRGKLPAKPPGPGLEDLDPADAEASMAVGGGGGGGSVHAMSFGLGLR